MAKHYPEQQPVDDDIQQAVEHLDEEMLEAEELSTEQIKTAGAWNSVMFPMPATTNRLILAHWAIKNVIWGMWEAGRKAWQFARRKPWVTLGTFGVAFGFCPVCHYTTGLIIAGYFCYAVKNEQ